MNIAKPVKQFFKAFRKVVKSGKWMIVDDYGSIRHRNGWCPMAFCASRRGHNYTYAHDAVGVPSRRLGLTFRQASHIASAADNTNSTSAQVRQYRKHLLSAVGL